MKSERKRWIAQIELYKKHTFSQKLFFRNDLQNMQGDY